MHRTYYELYMTVHDCAAHKPEAPAKETAVLRSRLRLVGCRITHRQLDWIQFPQGIGASKPFGSARKPSVFP